MANCQLSRIAISVPNKDTAAKFCEEIFVLERVSESRVATRLTDGVMNLTLLQFKTQEDAGNNREKDFVGLHHFGFWVDEAEASIADVEHYGSEYHPRPKETKNAEVKFCDPNGIIFDISTHGWDGAKR